MANPYGAFANTPITPHPAPNHNFNTGAASPSSDMPPPAAERIRRHPDYYLPGGDVYFLVQSNLFRVHRYFFERESSFFREKLGIPAAAGQTARGSSDANPFALEDVRSEDFEKFLWVFYNPKYSIYDADGVDTWEAILRLAYEWSFKEIKKLCCRELEKYEIEPVRKIAMYQTHELDRKLLIPSYAALTLRAEPLSFHEGRRLGLETALMLASAREVARVPASPARSPTAADVNDEVVAGIIRQIFGLDPGPPSPDLTPVGVRGVSFVTPTSPRGLSINTGSQRPTSPTNSMGGQSFRGAAEALATPVVADLFGEGSSEGGSNDAANETPANGATETEEVQPTPPPPAGPESTTLKENEEENKEENKEENREENKKEDKEENKEEDKEGAKGKKTTAEPPRTPQTSRSDSPAQRGRGGKRGGRGR